MKNNICAVYTDHFPRKVDFQLLLVKLVTLQQQKVRIRLHRGNSNSFFYSLGLVWSLHPCNPIYFLKLISNMRKSEFGIFQEMSERSSCF